MLSSIRLALRGSQHSEIVYLLRLSSSFHAIDFFLRIKILPYDDDDDDTLVPSSKKQNNDKQRRRQHYRQHNT